MPKLTDELRKELHDRSINNDQEILSSNLCSCFFCRQTYSARDVCDWANNEDGTMNAICPVCGMEAVIGDRKEGRLDHDVLKELNLYYFGEDYMNSHPEAAAIYCERYENNKISLKPQNEALYIHYLTLLAEQGSGLHTFNLAKLYLYGSKFTKRDLTLALALCMRPALINHPSGLVLAGEIFQNENFPKHDYRAAYECYAKALALNLDYAAISLADCYYLGIGVPEDKKFAMQCFYEHFGPTCSIFSLYEGENTDDGFIRICQRIAEGYEEGILDNKDLYLALKYYLIVSSWSDMLSETTDILNDEERDALILKAKKKVEELAASFSYYHNQPIFDAYTFVDTFSGPGDSTIPMTRCKLHLSAYDEDEQVAIFETIHPAPLLVVDVKNLFVGFFLKGLRWRFENVKSCRFLQDREFNEIEIDGENEIEEIKLINRDGPNRVLVADFVFDVEEEKEIDIKEGESEA